MSKNGTEFQLNFKLKNKINYQITFILKCLVQKVKLKNRIGYKISSS